MDALKTAGLGLLSALVGYAIGVPVSMWAVNTFSGNTHDKSLEAAMTSFFVWGPCVALVAAIAGIIVYRQWLKA